jgi:hypothetical protein
MQRATGSRLVAAASLFVVLACLPFALGACGGSNGEGNAEADSGKATTSTEKDFDRKNFSDSTTIDNKWSPLVPGTQYIFEGRSNRGLGRLPHRVVFTVTDLTKVVDGVPSVVLWDRDYNDGKLLEGELAFFSQDDDGNVWNMGEYPEEYDEHGNFEAAPDTWIAGLDRAKAGILMRGDPRVGTPSYHQGLAPSIGFADKATVQKTGQRNCVPVGCYGNVVVTDETNPTEPTDGHQLKYNAPGVGTIRAAPGVGGKEKEVLVLVKVVRLNQTALGYASREALKLEKRAYRERKDLFAHTQPSKRTPPAQ